MSDDDWFYRNEAEREWSLTLQELDVVRADLVRVTAERDRLIELRRTDSIWMSTAYSMIPVSERERFGEEIARRFPDQPS